MALPDEVAAIHRRWLDIEDTIAPLLRLKNIPSRISETVMAGLESAFLENFMGYGNRKVQ